MINTIPHFRARTRLLAQLGEQLIKSQSIAIQELIKNSYDADASYCFVQLLNMLEQDKGIISIIDDGIGMDYNILYNTWLDIGTSYKSDIKKSNQKRTQKYNRIPLGEKGIGRFGVHRLGSEIEIVTRMEGKKECVLYINWNDIENSTYIEDFPISITERDPKSFVNSTGTQITIRKLKGEWTRGSVRECARAIMSLNSPFDDISSFNVELQVPNTDWLDGLISYKDIESNKLFTFEARIEGAYITDFKYDFTPYQTMSKILPRTITYADIKKTSRVVNEVDLKIEEIDLSTEEIGPVIMKGVIFDLDSKVLNLASLTDKKGFKEYLSKNGGVRVFRDNMRIWDYGEPENDWLELETKRVNRPSFKLSKKLILAAVYLDGDKSKSLIEKANREGFMDNKAYYLLKEACGFILEKVEFYRENDKKLIRKYYGPTPKDDPIITSLSELKDIIKENVKDDDVIKEVDRYLDRIQNDFETITNNLIRSAGAGLNLIYVIHQMQKIVKNLVATIESNADSRLIENQVKELARLIEGYSILVRKSDIKKRNIKGILNNILFNVEFRLKIHNIEIEYAYKNRNEKLDCICSENHVMNAVLNIIDNSIWWLEYANINERSIYIDISPDLFGYITIVIADNGPGFAIPIELLGKPFISGKPNGMGIGLHLNSLIMDSLGGKVIFPSWGDFSIPIKYKNGAIIALAFKNGDKNDN